MIELGIYGPIVINFEEIDAIGIKRDGKLNDDKRHAINTFLDKLSTLHEKHTYVPVIVIGTTNDVTLLDSALIRWGRFEIVEFKVPSEKIRKQIIHHILSNLDNTLSR